MDKSFAVLFALLVGGVSVACHHRAEEAPGTAVSPAGCRGRRLAVVTNNWSEPVEIFARVGGDPTRLYVGTLNSGRREQFLLPDGARYAFAQPVGATDRAGTMPASSRDLVDIRYLCE